MRLLILSHPVLDQANFMKRTNTIIVKAFLLIFNKCSFLYHQFFIISLHPNC